MMLISSSASFPVLGQLINNGLFLCLVAEARGEVLLHMYNVISFYLILLHIYYAKYFYLIFVYFIAYFVIGLARCLTSY